MRIHTFTIDNIMKAIFTFLALAFASSAFAQITLDQGSYSNWTSVTDTVMRLDTSATYPNITSGQSTTWDMTSVTYDQNTHYFMFRKPVTSTAFPVATFYDSTRYVINPSLFYRSNVMGAITPNGFQYFGEHIPRQAIPIGSISGNSADSLVFIEQDIPYSSTRNAIHFPATMGSNWASDFGFTTNFNLTVLMYGINNAPCQRKTHLVENDTVIGYGTMQVKSETGQHSSPISVLMVKNNTIVIDSFFMNGAPASPLLLGAFGLTQGKRTTNYYYNFYREGEVTPLFFASYKDSTFSNNNADFMYAHIGNLQLLTGMGNKINKVPVSVYPNPIQGDIVTISVSDKTSDVLDYSITNLEGKTISTGTLLVNDGKATIETRSLNSAGIYYLQIRRAHELIATLPLIKN